MRQPPIEPVDLLPLGAGARAGAKAVEYVFDVPAVARAFYSGGEGAARDAAEQYVFKNGGVILEKTPVGLALDKTTKVLKSANRELADKLTAPLWEALSRNYAKNAREGVDAFLTDERRTGAVWDRIEKMELMKNGVPIREHRVPIAKNNG